MKICKHLILLFALSFAGCITYYRPDPLSGIDPPRTNRGTSVGVAFNRYAATAYFDGRGSSPHTKTTERPDRKYTRSDIIFSTFARIKGFTDVCVVLPISGVSQRMDPYGIAPDNWGIEHVWLGASLLRSSRRRANLLLVVGFPVNGKLSTLASAAESHNSSMRLMLEPLFSNGTPSGGFGYYLRLGAAIHVNPDIKGVSSIHELPCEFRVLVPLGMTCHIGFRADALFTLITYTGGRGTQSQDVVGIGPFASMALGTGWHIDAGYRSEVIGYISTAGSSWNVNMSYDFTGTRR